MYSREQAWRASKDSGSILLFLIIAMAVIAASAGTILTLNNTSLFSNVSTNFGAHAQYLAESGYRYAASEYLHAENISGKMAKLEELDGKNVVLGDDGNCSIQVCPYWFLPVTEYAAGVTRLNVKVPGHVNDGYRLPPSGEVAILSADDTPVTTRAIYSFTSFVLSDNQQATIDLKQPLKDSLTNSSSVLLVFHPSGSQPQTIGSGNDNVLTIDASIRGALPSRNGQICIVEDNATKGTYFYRELCSDSGSLTLKGITTKNGRLPLTVNNTTTIVLKRQIILKSTGHYGSWPFDATREIMYFVPVTDQLDATNNLDLGGSYAQDTFDNLDNWSTPAGNNGLVDAGADVFVAQGYKQGLHTQGKGKWKSKNYAVFHDATNVTDTTKQTFLLLHPDVWNTATMDRSSYTVQTKIYWGKKLGYTATGICLRWHKDPATQKYVGYGVSFMRYTSLFEDYIPDSIKPISQEKNLLIVLWKQYINNKKNVERTWIAYKNITDDWYMNRNENGNKAGLNDVSSLIVRVVERDVDGTFVNDIDVYYADAAVYGGNRSGDALYNNVCLSHSSDARQQYPPTYWADPAHSIRWPTWDLGAWSDSVDYFTLVDDVSVAESPTSGNNTFWKLNPALKAPDVTRPNTHTIRTTEFVPDGAHGYFLPGTIPEPPEIGLCAFGDLGAVREGNEKFVAFSDFAVELGDGSGAGSVSSFGTL